MFSATTAVGEEVKMKDWTNDELQQMLLKVTRRAAIDPEFRALALRDGAAAISKVTSKPLPKDITYQFVDNSGSIRIVPLPDPVLGTDELSDSELEDVAGGDGPTSPPISGGWSKIAPLQKITKKTK
jgi:hypothetical protein